MDAKPDGLNIAEDFIYLNRKVSALFSTIK